jgi:hypothetical protein
LAANSSNTIDSTFYSTFYLLLDWEGGLKIITHNDETVGQIIIFMKVLLYRMLSYDGYMSEVKDNMEDAGETMKRDTKKAGHRMEEGAEEAKDKID